MIRYAESSTVGGNRSGVPVMFSCTGNPDRRTCRELLDLLRRSVSELGQTVVMVTHDPAAAARTDRVLLLADGRVVDDVAEPSGAEVLRRLDELDELDRLDRTAAFDKVDELGDAAPEASR